MRYLTCAMLVACLFLVGCGESMQSKLSKYTEENIQKATMAYTLYVSMNSYRGPNNVEELTEFCKSNTDAQKRLEFSGIDHTKIEEYFVGRDGEPLKFIWGLRKNPLSPAYPVCYEQVGVDGTIQVGVSGGRIHNCESEEEVQEIIEQENYTAEDQEAYAPSLEE